jgi:PhzF family phenazine biosynthesis protein
MTIGPNSRKETEMLVYYVDAFTSTRFAGNPAAVCLPPGWRDEQWMHALAAEINLPKTAFAVREGHGDTFRLRWFGADGESSLCGHATLAAAHVLWECGQARPRGAIRFLTRSGDLAAKQLGGGWIELDFPAESIEPATRPELASELGVEAVWLGRSRLHFLLEVADESVVRSLRPDFRRLTAAAASARGVVVTSRAAAGDLDFVSRYFAPAVGIDEDQVTGSAHCALGPYWAAKLGKNELRAAQLSARGGMLRVRVDGERVHLAGQAVSVMRGQLFEPALEYAAASS